MMMMDELHRTVSIFGSLYDETYFIQNDISADVDQITTKRITTGIKREQLDQRKEKN